MTYYFISCGEVVNQMYKLEADNMRDAVSETEEKADDNDYIVEIDGNPEIITEYGEYHWIAADDEAVTDVAYWYHIDDSVEGMDAGWYIEYHGEYIPYKEW